MKHFHHPLINASKNVEAKIKTTITILNYCSKIYFANPWKQLCWWHEDLGLPHPRHLQEYTIGKCHFCLGSRAHSAFTSLQQTHVWFTLVGVKGEAGLPPGETWQFKQNAALLILPYIRKRLWGAIHSLKDFLGDPQNSYPRTWFGYTNLGVNYTPYNYTRRLSLLLQFNTVQKGSILYLSMA